METVIKIRRWVLVYGLPQREVSKRTGIARNTIARYLATDEEPRYKRLSEPKSLRLIDFEVILRGLYEADLSRPRRERRTIKGLYAALVVKAIGVRMIQYAVTSTPTFSCHLKPMVCVMNNY